MIKQIKRLDNFVRQLLFKKKKDTLWRMNIALYPKPLPTAKNNVKIYFDYILRQHFNS
jgi:hypothetical protein